MDGMSLQTPIVALSQHQWYLHQNQLLLHAGSLSHVKGQSRVLLGDGNPTQGKERQQALPSDRLTSCCQLVYWSGHTGDGHR